MDIPGKWRFWEGDSRGEEEINWNCPRGKIRSWYLIEAVRTRLIVAILPIFTSPVTVCMVFCIPAMR